ncbi:LysR substrate-binding domain-containing protein [Pectobacterium brasiliense]|uniref:LysR substrate-binding domain-containing protein n=1 Tax=Pectobacterium brasiliense TaxID=180957 RepID=UPI0035B54644
MHLEVNRPKRHTHRLLAVGHQNLSHSEAIQLTATIGMVTAGFGIALVPESLACIKADNVTYHDIGMPEVHTQIAAIWRKHERSPAIVNMIHLIRQHLSTQHPD